MLRTTALQWSNVLAMPERSSSARWSVLTSASAFSASDSYSRTLPQGGFAALWLDRPFRFGIPDDSQLTFFGDNESSRLFWRAAERLEAIGGVRTTIDFTVFREAAELLYSGPWVAERFAAVGEFLSSASGG